MSFFKANKGFTIFKATGVRHEYSHVNLEKQQVTCHVLYKDKIYMSVVVDVANDHVYIQGNVDELGDLSMNKQFYITMFKEQAQFFVDNQISDLKKYYDGK